MENRQPLAGTPARAPGVKCGIGDRRKFKLDPLTVIISRWRQRHNRTGMGWAKRA